MAKFHFFTDESKMSPQTDAQSYGQLPNQGGKQRYNLENKFTVATSAPVFAVTKSILLAVEDSADSDLLNIALLPVEGNYSAGFPVKFFIYRGVLKSSLIEGNGNIKEDDGTWGSNNILKLIKDLQDKINQDNNTSDVATSNSLGLQFGGLPEVTFLESILFDYTDDFHPLVIPKGCQIGLFSGGANLAGIQVVLDKVGSEASLQLLKSSTSVFEIDELVIPSGITEKEKLKLQFQNRSAKEEVLAYMDITAFYGACKNQSIRVTDLPNKDNFSTLFFNNDVVYVDIRDERGFSFNHFYKFNDTIEVGFYKNRRNIRFDETDYYEGWPILTLKNKSYRTRRKYFYLKLPILVGMPEVANVLTAFNKRVSVGSSRRSIRYALLNDVDLQGNTSLKTSEQVRLKNWEFDDDTLASNYFLLKIDRITNTDASQVLTPVWNSFFSLKMKHIFKLDDIADKEYRVKTYASVNAPLVTDKTSQEIFYPTIGIAADKYHITFFSFYRESAHRLYRKRDFQTTKAIDTGKFYNAVDTDKLDYQNSDQAVGFLYQIANNARIQDYELTQYAVTDAENQIQEAKFLSYLKTGELNLNDDFFENFDAITFTHQEYAQLLTAASVAISDTDFISTHPLFIRGKNNKKYRYNQFSLVETTVSLGVPKVVGNDVDNNYVVDLQEYPNDIQYNNEDITFISATIN